MNTCYLTLTTLCVLVFPLYGQSSILPEADFEVSPWFPDYSVIGAFDFSDTLFYLSDGDTIHQLDILRGTELNKYGLPDNYPGTHYVSFLTVAPDGNSIWTGYTSSDNLDDRIYSIDVDGGEWELQAVFPGNMDLQFWNDSILVSGLNSSSWDTPNAIYVLDTSGTNQHRKIIEVGGYSAGMALDTQLNLYYGTSYDVDANALYRWDSLLLQRVIEDPYRPVLEVTSGKKLTDLPAGIYDCTVDEGGNLLFTMNPYGGDKVVGMWDGTEGDGVRFDTLAAASGEWDWLGIIRSRGDLSRIGAENYLVTYSFGQPLVRLSRKNLTGLAQERSMELFIYPNPSTGYITIRTDRQEPVDLYLYTLQGSLVSRWTDLHSGAVIDISNHPASSYIIQVAGTRGSTSRIIQKL